MMSFKEHGLQESTASPIEAIEARYRRVAAGRQNHHFNADQQWFIDQALRITKAGKQSDEVARALSLCAIGVVMAGD